MVQKSKLGMLLLEFPAKALKQKILQVVCQGSQNYLRLDAQKTTQLLLKLMAMFGSAKIIKIKDALRLNQLMKP